MTNPRNKFIDADDYPMDISSHNDLSSSSSSLYQENDLDSRESSTNTDSSEEELDPGHSALNHDVTHIKEIEKLRAQGILLSDQLVKDMASCDAHEHLLYYYIEKLYKNGINDENTYRCLLTGKFLKNSSNTRQLIQQLIQLHTEMGNQYPSKVKAILQLLRRHRNEQHYPRKAVKSLSIFLKKYPTIDLSTLYSLAENEGYAFWNKAVELVSISTNTAMLSKIFNELTNVKPDHRTRVVECLNILLKNNLYNDLPFMIFARNEESYEIYLALSSLDEAKLLNNKTASLLLNDHWNYYQICYLIGCGDNYDSYMEILSNLRKRTPRPISPITIKASVSYLINTGLFKKENLELFYQLEDSDPDNQHNLGNLYKILYKQGLLTKINLTSLANHRQKDLAIKLISLYANFKKLTHNDFDNYLLIFNSLNPRIYNLLTKLPPTLLTLDIVNGICQHANILGSDTLTPILRQLYRNFSTEDQLTPLCAMCAEKTSLGVKQDIIIQDCKNYLMAVLAQQYGDKRGKKNKYQSNKILDKAKRKMEDNRTSRSSNFSSSRENLLDSNSQSDLLKSRSPLDLLDPSGELKLTSNSEANYPMDTSSHNDLSSSSSSLYQENDLNSRESSINNDFSEEELDPGHSALNHDVTHIKEIEKLRAQGILLSDQLVKDMASCNAHEHLLYYYIKKLYKNGINDENTYRCLLTGKSLQKSRNTRQLIKQLIQLRIEIGNQYPSKVKAILQLLHRHRNEQHYPREAVKSLSIFLKKYPTIDLSTLYSLAENEGYAFWNKAVELVSISTDTAMLSKIFNELTNVEPDHRIKVVKCLNILLKNNLYNDLPFMIFARNEESHEIYLALCSLDKAKLLNNKTASLLLNDHWNYYQICYLIGCGDNYDSYMETLSNLRRRTPQSISPITIKASVSYLINTGLFKKENLELFYQLEDSDPDNQHNLDNLYKILYKQGLLTKINLTSLANHRQKNLAIKLISLYANLKELTQNDFDNYLLIFNSLNPRIYNLLKKLRSTLLTLDIVNGICQHANILGSDTLTPILSQLYRDFSTRDLLTPLCAMCAEKTSLGVKQDIIIQDCKNYLMAVLAQQYGDKKRKMEDNRTSRSSNFSSFRENLLDSNSQSDLLKSRSPLDLLDPSGELNLTSNSEANYPMDTSSHNEMECLNILLKYGLYNDFSPIISARNEESKQICEALRALDDAKLLDEKTASLILKYHWSNYQIYYLIACGDNYDSYMEVLINLRRHAARPISAITIQTSVSYLIIADLFKKENLELFYKLEDSDLPDDFYEILYKQGLLTESNLTSLASHGQTILAIKLIRLYAKLKELIQNDLDYYLLISEPLNPRIYDFLNTIPSNVLTFDMANRICLYADILANNTLINISSQLRLPIFGRDQLNELFAICARKTNPGIERNTIVQDCENYLRALLVQQVENEEKNKDEYKSSNTDEEGGQSNPIIISGSPRLITTSLPLPTMIASPPRDDDSASSSIINIDKMEDDKTGSLSNFPSSSTTHDEVESKGRIHPKYTYNKSIPILPKLYAPDKASFAQSAKTYDCSITLKPITAFTRLTINAFQNNKVLLKQNNLFEFDYYPKLDTSIPSASTDNQTTSFIFAGRGKDAYIPEEDYRQRIILIITEDQIIELKDILPPHVEVMIIKQLNSASHGQFSNTQLGLLSARRLAAFLFAQVYNLDYFLVLDDNLTKIQMNLDDTGHNLWIALHCLMKNELVNNKAISCSLQTDVKARPIDKKSHFLGCKIFYYDLKMIKSRLNSIDKLFYLQAPAACANWPLEDYYLQLSLTAFFEDVGKLGYYTVARGKASVTRSSSHRNFCAKVCNKIEDTYSSKKRKRKSMLDFIIKDKIEPDDMSCLKKAHTQLLKIIQENQQFYHRKRNYVATLDLSLLQNKINQQHRFSKSSSTTSSSTSRDIVESLMSATTDESCSAAIIEENVSKRVKLTQEPKLDYYENNDDEESENELDIDTEQCTPSLWDAITTDSTLIKNLKENYPFLRKQQIENIISIIQSKKILGYSNITTGIGKTLIKCILCNIAFEAQQSRAHKKSIFIVLPNIQLLNQAYQDFITYLDHYKKSVGKFYFTKADILKISSNSTSISNRIFLLNKTWPAKNHIVMLCLDSFMGCLTHWKEEKHKKFQPGLLLLDEMHKIGRKQLKDILSYVIESKIPTYFYTGTMHSAHRKLFDELSEKSKVPIFKDVVSRLTALEHGFLVPLVVEKMPMAKLEEQHNKILNDLQNKIHPNGKPLFNYKGIIYAPTIEYATKLAKFLNCHMKVDVIHGKIANKSTVLRDFKESCEPRILVAVNMLRMGYDDPNLYWTYYLQYGSDPKDVAQVAGRLVRKDAENPGKIGYMITTSTANLEMLNINLIKPAVHSQDSEIFSDLPDIHSTIIKNHALYLKSLLQQQEHFLIGQYTLFGANSFKSNYKIFRALCQSSNLPYAEIKANEDVCSKHIDIVSPQPIKQLILNVPAFLRYSMFSSSPSTSSSSSSSHNHDAMNIEKTPGSLYEELLIATQKISREKGLQTAIQASKSTDTRQQSIARLYEEASSFGLKCHEIAEDGNCFFHAIAHQLKQIGQIPPEWENIAVNELHIQLRAKAVQHIIQYLPYYRHFSDARDDNELIGKLSRPGEWADHLICLALSRAMNRTIVIIRNNTREEPTIMRQNSPYPPLYLGYEVDLHYWSLTHQHGIIPNKNIQACVAQSPLDIHWQHETELANRRAHHIGRCSDD